MDIRKLRTFHTVSKMKLLVDCCPAALAMRRRTFCVVEFSAEFSGSSLRKPLAPPASRSRSSLNSSPDWNILCFSALSGPKCPSPLGLLFQDCNSLQRLGHRLTEVTRLSCLLSKSSRVEIRWNWKRHEYH